MKVFVSLTQSDLECIAKGLDALTALRAEQGLRVEAVTYDDLILTLTWTDEGGYTVGSIEE